MTCQIKAMNAGGPYPRTCPECGFGSPCKYGLTNPYSKPDTMDDLTEAVARALCKSRIVSDCTDACETGCKAMRSALVSSGRDVQARAAIRAVLDGIDTTDASMVERMLDAYWGQADTDDAPMDHAPMQTAATAMIDHLRERLDAS